jgi:DNA-binding NarL/FixJ family response regulator
MQDETIKRIDEKLDIVMKLLASSLIKGMSNKTEAILTLGACGIDVSTIADLVGTTSATVSTRLSEQKKKGGKKYPD